MTNILTYYTLAEKVIGITLMLGFIGILLIYNSYYLKKRSGIFLLLTLLTPPSFSSIFYIFSKSFNLDPSGFNTVAILWIPFLFTFTHSLYYITRLSKNKTNIKDIRFDFLKDIKRETLFIVLILLLVTISTFAIFPIKFAIPFAIGWLNIAISSLINTIIIIKRI